MSGTLGSIYHHQLLCSERFCVHLHVCWVMACSGVHLPPHQVQLLSQGPAEGAAGWCYSQQWPDALLTSPSVFRPGHALLRMTLCPSRLTSDL